MAVRIMERTDGVNLVRVGYAATEALAESIKTWRGRDGSAVFLQPPADLTLVEVAGKPVRRRKAKVAV